MRKTLLAASALALAVAAPFASAYQAGDIIVRAGAITVDPNESSSNISTGVTGPLAGNKATLDSDTQLGLNFAYMVTDNIGIELLAATPFQHTVGVKGDTVPGLIGGDKFADIKHLPPTVSALYYPMDSNSAFQPYVGLGINYTTFFSEDLSSGAKSAGFSGLSLQDSWGLAGQVGMDYFLTDNIMLNAQVRYIDIETTATARHSTLGKVKVDVDDDPWVYMGGLGYKF